MNLDLFFLAIAAIGFGVQQFLQTVGDPLVSIALTAVKNRQPPADDGTRTLPGGISDVDAKKALLGLMALVLGWLIVRASDSTLLILKTLEIQGLGGWDVFITALTIGAGTEGANSVLKLVQYAKDAVKAKTLPSTAQNSPVVQEPSHWLTEGPRGLELKPGLKRADDESPDVDDADGLDEPAAPADGSRPAALRTAAAAPAAAWRDARCLRVLLREVDAKAPNRRTGSDGTIGDASHQTRDSDHNPWVTDGGKGVVTAIDITHDPAHGCDADQIAEALRRSRDPRIKYIIRNRRMARSYAKNGRPAWEWQPYTGENPHTSHVHISVKPEKALYDDESPWGV